MLSRDDSVVAHNQPLEAALTSSADALKEQLSLHRKYADADIIRLAVFFRTNPNPVLVFNPEGSLIKTNPAADRLLKRLQVTPIDLLPAEHHQVVRDCLQGELKEYTIEIVINQYTLVLNYHPMTAFGIVYLYAIELTEFKQAEEELIKRIRNTMALARSSLLQLRKFKHSFVQRANQNLPTFEATLPNSSATTDLFVAMDGCVFSSAHTDEK